VNPQRRLWLQQLAAGTGAAWSAAPTAWATGAPATTASAATVSTNAVSSAAAWAPSSLGPGPAPGGALTDRVRPGRPLRFPQDHGAHAAQRIEWWYATGWLGTEAAPSLGWQVTFFRSATGLGQGSRSRFAPRHVLFAHAAVTDLGSQQHHHAQRLARWSGLPDAAPDAVALDRGDVRLAGWSLTDEGPGWRVQVAADAFALDLELRRTQPLLLQGALGFSLKGPPAAGAAIVTVPNVKDQGLSTTLSSTLPTTQLDNRYAKPHPSGETRLNGSPFASHYYSEPQLAARARRPPVATAKAAAGLQGRAWLDHEWSDALLPPQAVGWDWIGFNLFDGSALTAFQLRRADGTPLWAGGSWRAAPASLAVSQPGAAPAPRTAVDSLQNFGTDAVAFRPGARWRSGASGANYPLQWSVTTPAGRFEVRALLQAQELDSRTGTGAFYWEGLSELLDTAGRRIGLGYLEMTGYAGRLRWGTG
jgi:predicted secreted hydrolase